MEIIVALTAVTVALVAGVFLYRHRKVRKTIDEAYGFWSPPTSGNPSDRGTEFFCGQRSDNDST